MNETLKKFNEYCEANPEEHFWQALRSFTGADFIFRGMSVSSEGGERVTYNTLPVYIKDTFYD